MCLPIRKKICGLFVNQVNGFTLIELLVTVSIILLVTGAGIAGFVNFNDRQQVQTTVKEVQDLMRAAQVKARSGEGAIGASVAEGCVVPNKLKGYEVTVGNGVVLLNRICVDPITTLVASTTERSRVTLENVSVELDPSNTVTFLALKGGVDLGGAASLTVTVEGTYSSTTYTFQVLSTGEITEGAFGAPPDDT